ncbi:WxL domain-containing protein [Enterococcus faecalis]|uniref:WxL domain-containing protein n=10 Tax=Enterococcus faecalis TaxID=1351 RepID=UPI0008FCC4B0|nr:WxL domain-containing protein [Enterococcus faecalis]MCL4906437.1 WxL domain-containing protein [Enterococcus faecalis]MDL4859531.1 WxL domain-containing protein [Enterococcus faecalis]MDL4872282.1 WxL domain-containing protein [Enterococcus faecalis]MDL4878982.1 WxL domain-containing protein [Enterococcus faecalis]MDL4910888.1 WxL domain-containing protein [Enterococcus faecalis]
MKQTKWQRLATIGLCSSLVINAFSGVTAVAETITIESSPTVASSVKEETTKASTETSEATTETSREVMKEQETEESVKQEVVKEKEEPKEKVEQDIVAPSINKISPRATVIFPESIFQIGFVDEKGALVAPENVSIKYDYINWEQNAYSNRFTSSIITPNVEVPNVNGLKQIVLPAANIAQTNYPGPNGTGIQNAYRGTAPANFSISIPKYYENLSLYDQSGNISPAYPLPIVKQRNKSGIFALDLDAMKFYLNVKKKDDGTYTNTIENNFKTTTLRWPIIMERWVDSVAMGTHYSYYSEGPVYYHLTNRKVTESFKDTAGATIPAPTGFTQGKQTSITSNNYTFKQAGTLPETYKASNGKTYKFKGWYKGKTKPNTLTTTKAPSYAVTYDDNDDLNVVYEETKEKTTTIPAVTYKFGFVDEKGALVTPTNFNMTTNLTTIMNGTPKQVGTASGVNNGNLKQLTIPSQQLTHTPSVSPAFSGSTNFRVTVPKQYKLPTVKPGTYYTGSSTTYPTATTRFRYVGGVLPDSRLETDGKEYGLFATTTDHSYRMFRSYWIPDTTKTYFSGALSRASAEGNTPAYYTTDETIYYFLENRRVTENFVDTSGAKITAPTGFTQGKKTVITSDAYTFKQAGTLPDTYTTGGKTYKFKGWYKGKSIINTLTTTKAPSYAVTYDDNDDLNVVYEEETVTTLYPSINMNFVNEKGGAFTPALTFSGKYYAQSTSASLRTDLYDVTSKNNGNGQYTVSINNGSMPLSQELLKKYNNGQPISATNRLQFNVDKLTIDQQLKYVDGIQVDTAQSSSLNYYGHKYTSGSSTIFDPNVAPTEYNMTTEQINSLNFSSDGTYFSNANNRFFNMHLGYSSSGGSLLLMMALFNENPVNQTKLVYKVTRKQVTENFVDANGAKITAPTGFTQGNKIPMTSNTFKYTAAKALPATYTAGGKTYTFQGWYKGKTKPNTLTTSTTPTYNTTFDGNDDMTAMYKEEVPKASVALTRTTAETVTSGGNVTWRATITNTSQAPLTTATIKKSTAWTTGLAAPTAMIVTPAGGTAKTVPVTATTWTNGVSLGTDIPVGKSATVQFTTKATGTAGQVLRAGITTSGNYSGVSTSATVRVKDNDQAIVTPTAEGFISVPTFNFGQVGVAGSTQQHSLKKAADYYGNGTRNPYLRIKKTQPNWSLTAQLSQPKSATDSLPTATRLLLGAAPVSSFSNYNQPTELKNAVGTTSAISLNANNTATRIIANQQFTGSNIYQLDFTFNNVKLEVPANQGVKGQQYQAAVTWNLVTGP